MRIPASLLALLVISACSGSNDGASPTATRTSASASASASASPASSTPVEEAIGPYQNQDDSYIHFASPTGNILCDLGSESDIDFLTCHIREHVWSVPDCPSGHSASLTLGIGEDEAAHVACSDFPTDGANYRTLPYGHSISGIDIVCVSATAGMTCHDEHAPYGRFFLSKARCSLTKDRG